MARLNLVTYSLQGQRLQEITEARNIQASVDSLTFELPVVSTEISYFDNDIALGVEVEELAGLTYGLLKFTQYGEFFPRYIYKSASESRDPNFEVFSFTAPAIAASVFAKWPILPELSHQKQYGPTDTPYTVIAHRVAESQARVGANRGVIVVDGGGWASSTAGTSVGFDNHAYLSDFYNSLVDGKTADLFWVGTTLTVAAPGTMAIDRSASVQFQIETDFTDIPENVDRGSIADTILGVGEGIYSLHPGEAPGDVSTVQFSGITDQTILNNLTQQQWQKQQDATHEVTATLALGSNPRLLFGRDYFVGSLVTVPTKAGGTEVLPVAQITVTRDMDPDLGGNVVFGAKIPSHDVRIAQILKSSVGGSTTLLGGGAVVLPLDYFSTSLVITLGGASGSATISVGRTFAKPMNFVVQNANAAANPAQFWATVGGSGNTSGSVQVSWVSGAAGGVQITVIGVAA